MSKREKTKRDAPIGKGSRIMSGPDAKRAMMMERMPDEPIEKGFPLGERFGGEHRPTKYQSYTTGGVIYDDFTAPEHVDDLHFE
jgi:hypothetical protein